VGAFGVIRAAMFVVGALFILGGFGLLTLGGPVAAEGLWLVAIGGGLMIVAALERRRYRSEAAERANEPIGPGGGETERVEPRFRPTPEIFVDPTSGRRMRVMIDPATGERRYIAEA